MTVKKPRIRIATGIAISANEKPELTKEVEAGYKKICDDFASTGAW